MLMSMLPAGPSIMDPIAFPVCSVVILWGQKR
jgi:hypothetical protein